MGAWVRTQGLESKGIGILMAIQNTPKGADYARNTVVQFGPTPAFRLLLQEFVTGPDTVSLNVYSRLCSVPPTATVWCDDVFLYEVTGGAATLAPPLQVTAQPLPGEGVVSVTVDLTQIENYYRDTPLTCRVALTDRESGRTVRRAVLDHVAAERQTLRLDARGLEGGEYMLTARLLAPGNVEIHRAEQAVRF